MREGGGQRSWRRGGGTDVGRGSWAGRAGLGTAADQGDGGTTSLVTGDPPLLAKNYRKWMELSKGRKQGDQLESCGWFT